MSHGGNRSSLHTLLRALFVCIYCHCQIHMYLTNGIEFTNIKLRNAVILCYEHKNCDNGYIVSDIM